MEFIEIPGYEGYKISREGIMLLPSGKMRKAFFASAYPYFKLMIGGKRVTLLLHRAIALSFIPNPNNKPEVNHIDHNKHNFSVDNLEWVTHKENMEKASIAGKMSLGGVPRGYKFSETTKSKMSERKKRTVELVHDDGHTVTLPSINDAAAFFGISRVMFFLIRRDGLKRDGYTINFR